MSEALKELHPTQQDGAVATAVQPSTGTAALEAKALRGRLQTFSSLRHRDYRYLWAGTLFMSAGQWIQQVTLGWLLYDLTGSAVLLGALNGLRALPFLVSGLAAGVIADRMDRRRLMLVAQAVLLVTALGMGLVVVSPYLQVWHLFAFTLITGIAWSFNQPVRQTLVPAVVPKEDLANAVALSSAGFNITKVAGPTLGGLLIASFGAGGNFFVQAAAYLGVLYMVFRMRVPNAQQVGPHGSAFGDLKEGLRYVWASPVVLALMLAALIPNIFAMPYQALMPVFQKDVLDVGPEALGVMLAAPGLGAFLAMMFLASVAASFRHKGLLLLIALVCLGVSLILFSRTTILPLALISLVLVGGSQMLFMATTNTLLQLTIPDELRGRVMSIYMLDHGLAPAGALLGGISTAYIGAPNTVTIMGIMVILLALAVGWWVPRLRRLE